MIKPKRSKSKTQLTSLKQYKGETEDRAEKKWLELTEKTFDFATNAREAFIHGDMDNKRTF